MKKSIILLTLTMAFNSNAQKAGVKIIGEVKVKLESLKESDSVFQIEDGEKVPGGFKLVAKGRWRTGPVTLRCSEHRFKNLTVEKAREIGATHYRLYDFKEPIPILNTCYKSKVLFFIKE